MRKITHFLFIFFLGLLFLFSSCSKGKEKAACPIHFSRKADTKVRLFTIGHKFSMDEAQSFDSFKKAYVSEVEKIKGCLSKKVPNLLVFPEDTSLVAAFIGDKGKDARESGDSTSAMLKLSAAYSDEINFYRSIYPDAPFQRLLLLSLTDNAWRSLVETFGYIAKRYGVYVVATVNVSGDVKKTDSPDIVKLFGRESYGYVFTAALEKVYNMAVVFDPHGKIIAVRPKIYLVPDEYETLQMTPGEISKIQPVSLPFATVGIVISKDAWMPDVLERLDIEGVNLLLQPEAFQGWGYDPYGGWYPTVVKLSSWNDVQKFPSILYSGVPMLNGNFFDIVFDGQTHIVKKSSHSDTLNSFVGQEKDYGFYYVSPWAFPDPGVTDPELSLDERRAILNKYAEELAPGSGSSYENRYKEGILIADLTFKLPSPSEALVDSSIPSGEKIDVVDYERFPALATSPDGRVFIAFSGRESEGERVYLTVVKNGKVEDVLPVSGYGGRRPGIVFTAGRLFIVWEEKRGSSYSTVVSFSVDGKKFRKVDVGSPAGEDAHQWIPSIDGRGNRVAVAWVGYGTGEERIYLSVSEDGGNDFSMWLRVDEEGPSSDHMDSSFSPSVAVGDDGYMVSWIDFRNFSWDIYADFVTEIAGKNFRVDDAGDKIERLHSDPVVRYGGGRRFYFAWADVRGRGKYPMPAIRFTSYENGVIKTSEVVDDGPAWFPDIDFSPSGRRVAVVWQGYFEGERVIYMKVRENDGFGERIRISRMTQASRPAVKFMGEDKLIVAWEQIENGKTDIRYRIVDISQ